MIEIVYIYNVFLIILYTLTLGIVLTYSLNSEKNKKYLFFVVGLYLVFFIFDNLILSMTEIIKDFGNTYNQHFLGVPFVKTVIYLVNNICQFWIVARLRKETPLLLYFYYFHMDGFPNSKQFSIKSFYVLFTQSASFDLYWYICETKSNIFEY